LLAAGDLEGLLALNRSTYGDALMARGYAAFGDVMRRTADGRDLNELFNEFQAAATAANEQQQRFVDLLTYSTSSPVVSVLQSLGTGDYGFEEASEFGIPTSKRISPSTLDLGATFRWYDNRWGATWQYLADATAAELEAATNAILSADADLVFNKVMGTLFSSANRTVTDQRTNTSYTVFAFANSDGWTPPTYAGNSFNGTHTHFRTSGAATINSADLDEIIADFKSHGYSQENGSQIVLFVNASEGDVISTFRVATSAKADFVPAQGARFYSPNQLVGDQPAATYAGFPVKGAYDEALIIESSRIPAGYVAALVSGGSNLPSNPIMLREHSRIKGLQLIPGRNGDYPLLDSYWVRGFGTGVRHRLAGMVMQISTNANYTAPALYPA
jgi:hypothetical protein